MNGLACCLQACNGTDDATALATASAEAVSYFRLSSASVFVLHDIMIALLVFGILANVEAVLSSSYDCQFTTHVEAGR